MILPEGIRRQVADHMVRVMAPVMLLSMGAMISVLLLGQTRNYYRLVPTLMVSFAAIRAWFWAVRGKPLMGAGVLLFVMSLAILAAMTLCGGVRAPAYLSSIWCLTMFTIFFGTWGGVGFALFIFTAGGVFLFLERTGVISPGEALPDLHYWLLIGTFLLFQLCSVLIPVRLMYGALTRSRKQADELERAVNERRKSQMEMQSILNKTPDIIYRLDPLGVFTFVSDAVKKYGHSPDEFIGNPLIDWVHPDDRLSARPMLLERRAGKRGSTDVEVRLLLRRAVESAGPEWSMFHISSEGVYAGDEQGKRTYLGTQGIARDVSETKQYESQVLRLAAVIEQASEDVLITDAQGVIQYVNPKFETLTGYAREEVIGKTPAIVKSGKHDPKFYKNLWETIKGGQTWNGKISNRIRNGQIIIQDVTITPIFDSLRTITGFVSVRRDVTEQERFEERLEQSRKMEAIGTLAGGIAHDFNNILGAILGYSELALADLDDKGAVKHYLEQIFTGGERATELVRQILLFSRQTKQEKQPVRIVSLAKEVIKLLRASLPAEIQIRTEFFCDRDLVISDPAQIHQIFMNLCTNAAHAMKARGGILSIRIRSGETCDIPVDSAGKPRPGPFIIVEVSDTGHGMSEEVRKKIFNPFFTTKPRDEGTGMGLSVVYGIVEGHEGAIHVRSQPGQGSTFTVFLPAVPEASVEPSPVQPPVPGGNEHVLVVDDEPALSALCGMILEKLGYKTTVFSDSLAALAAFTENPGGVDLVITDNRMPGITGLDLARQIRSIRPELPVIMCTGFRDESATELARQAGIRRVISKPVVSAAMGRAVRSVLDAKP